MALEIKYDNVVAPKKTGKKNITKLTVLDRQDKNTIYNLIFAEMGAEIRRNG